MQLPEQFNRRLHKGPFYPPLVKTYQLTESECDYLQRLAHCDLNFVTYQTLQLDSLSGLEDFENLKIKLNTDSQERMVAYGQWLMSGECPIVATEPDKLRICIPEPKGCGLAYGIASFPFYPLDDRCVWCIQKCVAPEPTRAKKLATNRALQSMLNVAKRPDVMSPHISHVLGQIYALDGGSAGFARSVHDHILALREKDPAGFALTKMYVGLLNLTAQATKLDQEVVNLDDIDDAGLKRYLKDMLITKMTKEEAVRYIQDANAEVEGMVLDHQRQQEELDAQKALASL